MPSRSHTSTPRGSEQQFRPLPPLRIVRDHATSNPTAVREVAVEFARTLLYLEDDYNMPGFTQRMLNGTFGSVLFSEQSQLDTSQSRCLPGPVESLPIESLVRTVAALLACGLCRTRDRCASSVCGHTKVAAACATLHSENAGSGGDMRGIPNHCWAVPSRAGLRRQLPHWPGRFCRQTLRFVTA